MNRYTPLFEFVDRETSIIDVVEINQIKHFIIDTKHSVERFLQRVPPNIKKDTILGVIKKAMLKIVQMGDISNTSYLVHSQSTNIGVILFWRPESDPYISKDRRSVNNAVIVTILPLKKQHISSDPKDTILMVEGSNIQAWNKNSNLTLISVD